MRIMTKFLGETELDEQRKLVFPRGLYGFEQHIEYALLEAEPQPFFYLQSLSDKDVCFIVIDPFLFRPDFEVDIESADMELISIQEPKQAAVLAIVTIPSQDSGLSLTANLQGPLVINRETNTGCQIVQNDPRWKTKHDIVAELEDGRK